MRRQIIIDRETIFQLVSKKDWQKLIEVFKDNDYYQFISSEPVLKPLIDVYFIGELLTNSTMKDDPGYKYCLQNFYMLHEDKKKTFRLSEDNFKKLIVKIVEIEEINRAYDYALRYPEEPIIPAAITRINVMKCTEIEISSALRLPVLDGIENKLFERSNSSSCRA